jgi:hypothetical protein
MENKIEKTPDKYTVVFDNGVELTFKTFIQAKIAAMAEYKHFKELLIDGEVVYNRFNLSNGTVSFVGDYI